MTTKYLKKLAILATAIALTAAYSNAQTNNTSRSPRTEQLELIVKDLNPLETLQLALDDIQYIISERCFEQSQSNNVDYAEILSTQVTPSKKQVTRGDSWTVSLEYRCSKRPPVSTPSGRELKDGQHTITKNVQGTSESQIKEDFKYLNEKLERADEYSSILASQDPEYIYVREWVIITASVSYVPQTGGLGAFTNKTFEIKVSKEEFEVGFLRSVSRASDDLLNQVIDFKKKHDVRSVDLNMVLHYKESKDY